jgi:D-tyrosyl-tRNA(Tyr) deacylase
MNRSLREAGGGLLLVPQFTLAADTERGLRPVFGAAAPPEAARSRFEELLTAARAAHREVAAGEFGASMQLSLVNDGPVTFWLEVAPAGRGRTLAGRAAPGT